MKFGHFAPWTQWIWAAQRLWNTVILSAVLAVYTDIVYWDVESESGQASRWILVYVQSCRMQIILQRSGLPSSQSAGHKSADSHWTDVDVLRSRDSDQQLLVLMIHPDQEQLQRISHGTKTQHETKTSDSMFSENELNWQLVEPMESSFIDPQVNFTVFSF